MSWGSAAQAEGTASAEAAAPQLLASTDTSFFNILSYFKSNTLQLHFTAYIRHSHLVIYLFFSCTVIFEIK